MSSFLLSIPFQLLLLDYIMKIEQANEQENKQTMDLRYCIPPVMNLIFFLFLSPLNWNLLLSSFLVQQFSVLQLGFVILVMMFLLLFLFTSVELPLILNPIRFRAGAFSVALTASFLASLFFPPSLFWPLHLLIVFSSPWHGLFFDVSNHCFRWFSGTLRSVSTYTVMIIARNDPTPTEEDVELGLQLTDQHDEGQLCM